MSFKTESQNVLLVGHIRILRLKVNVKNFSIKDTVSTPFLKSPKVLSTIDLSQPIEITDALFTSICLSLF